MRGDFMSAISFRSFWIRFCSVNWFGFLRVFGLDKSFQIGEAHGPEVSILIEPGIDGAERFRIELVDAMAALAVLLNQMSAAQQAQVFGDGGPGNGKGLGDFSGRLAAAAQKIKHRAAGGVGEGLESLL
jgi:hypothetical protein